MNKSLMQTLVLTLVASFALASAVQAASLNGQVVRITQNKTTTPNPLQLAEVEVFEDGTLTNLALAGTASQSSQLGGFGPGNAIDGNLANFQHTLDQVGGGQTWEVDLGASFALDSIQIHARQGCCGQDRTADILLQVFSDAAATDLVFEEQVLGLGDLPSQDQSRLITLPDAVPEPASMAIWSLIGLGLAGFGYYRKRRKK